jgi:hypothetical protein
MLRVTSNAAREWCAWAVPLSKMNTRANAMRFMIRPKTLP